MLLDLRRVFEGDDQRVPFVHQMDLSQIEQWGDRPFAEPVQLEGYVQNRAGIVTVHYTASYLLSTACARCLDPVERRVRTLTTLWSESSTSRRTMITSSARTAFWT